MSPVNKVILDKCKNISEKIVKNENLTDHGFDIILDAVILSCMEGIKNNDTGPKSFREVFRILKMRLKNPAKFYSKVEELRPVAEFYFLDNTEKYA